ncbi:MAG: hypothetical protein FWG68_02355, partial [Defluviitaleaceae bacterium]|nr:hypothetical protein [Defluviitaleaceae bacterium]
VILTLEQPKLTEYISESITFKPIIICLKERDADEALQNLQAQLKKGEPINELELIYLPLYNSKSGKTRLDLAINAVSLTDKISQKKLQNKLQGMLLMQLVNYLTKNEMKKLLEECAMILEGKPALEAFEEFFGEKYKSEGIAIGTAIGLAQGATQIAVEMLKDGMNVQKISSLINKPIEWVQELQAKLSETPQ